MVPRRPAARWFAGAFAVVALVHLGAQLAGGGIVADATQVLLMPLLAGRAVVRDIVATRPARHPRARRPGPVVARRQRPQAGRAGTPSFLVMVGFFLLAQVAYIAAFLPYRDRSVLHVHRVRLLGYLAAVVALVARVRRWGRRDAGAGAASTAGAWARWPCSSTGVNRLTAVGGALFLVSDGLIALDAFVDGFGLPRAGLLGDGHLPRRPGAHRRRRAARGPACAAPTPSRRMPSALA